MRVLVLGWEYPPAVAGGLGVACRGLTTALADRGHRVVLATPRLEGAPDPEPHPGVTRIAIAATVEGDARPGRALPLDPYATDDERAASTERGAATQRLYGRDLRVAVDRYTRAAVDALAETEFDVIHAHDWMTVGAALRLRFQRKRPFVFHVHSTAYDRQGGESRGRRGPIADVERVGARTADAICTVSGHTRGVLTREYGVDPGRVHVVYNAPTEDVPLDAPHATPHAPTVLFVGRLTRQKGVGFLLRAAVEVLRQRPDGRFVVVGDGEERARLVELAASLGIARRVFFTGSIDDAARERAYRTADVLVLPSVSEPFGLTPIEALQRGVPVVVSDACGAREILASAPSVPPWDAPQLAGEILRLLGDPGLRDDLVARGRAELDELSWNRSAASLERAFEGVLAAER